MAGRAFEQYHFTSTPCTILNLSKENSQLLDLISMEFACLSSTVELMELTGRSVGDSEEREPDEGEDAVSMHIGVHELPRRREEGGVGYSNGGVLPASMCSRMASSARPWSSAGRERRGASRARGLRGEGYLK